MAADEILLWTLGVLSELEWWAKEVGRPRWETSTPMVRDGVRWHWKCCDANHDVPADPVVDTSMECVIDRDPEVALCSVERFAYGTIIGDGPSLALASQEVPTIVAGYLLRRDPHRTITDVRATKRLLDNYSDGLIVKLTAARFADWPGYREEWRP